MAQKAHPVCVSSAWKGCSKPKKHASERCAFLTLHQVTQLAGYRRVVGPLAAHHRFVVQVAPVAHGLHYRQ
jgi:hypothetical protein